MTRKLIVVIAFAVAASVGLASAASAATTSIRPGGAIVARGVVTLRNSGFSASCTVSLGGNITAGTYSVGGTVARFGSASATGCTGGATVNFLNAPSWSLGVLSILFFPPGFLGGIGFPFAILVTIGTFRCLFQGLLGVLVSTAGWTILPLPLTVSNDALNTPLCVALGALTASGSMTVTPAQTVTVI